MSWGKYKFYFIILSGQRHCLKRAVVETGVCFCFVVVVYNDGSQTSASIQITWDLVKGRFWGSTLEILSQWDYSGTKDSAFLTRTLSDACQSDVQTTL